MKGWQLRHTLGRPPHLEELIMNEGTIAILSQWSLLCLVWMGSMDAQLQEIGIAPKRMLAVICAFLICTFVSWKVYFAPVEISLSGALLPLLASGWLYYRLPHVRRRLYFLGACATAMLLFWLRWLFFTDPVLLFWEEGMIVPTAGFLSILAMSRNGVAQLFQVMFALPLADALHSLFFWKLSGSCVFGNEYAQDLLWSTISLWGLVSVIRFAVVRILKWRKTLSSDPNERKW